MQAFKHRYPFQELVLERQALKHKVYVELTDGTLMQELEARKYRPEFYLFCADVIYSYRLRMSPAVFDSVRQALAKLKCPQTEELLEAYRRPVKPLRHRGGSASSPKSTKEPDAQSGLSVQFTDVSDD